MLLVLNLFGVIIMAAAGWFFFRVIFWLRPHDSFRSLMVFQISGIVEWAGFATAILALTALHIILHEAIHGIFFWLFTRSRPLFSFRLAYAYAAAPDWFIPRNLYLITTLAPFVLISLLGLAICMIASPIWLLPTWFIITTNAGGAAGDIMVALWLLRQPGTCLAQDRGDAVTLFVPSLPLQRG